MSRHTKQGEEESFIVPVVSLATVRDCRLNLRGHLCHSIHASQAIAEVREGGGVAVALLSADVVERHGLDVSRLVLSGPSLGRIAVVHHDPQLVARITPLIAGTGASVPLIWAPMLCVLFGQTSAQRTAIDGGGITLAHEDSFEACPLPEPQ